VQQSDLTRTVEAAVTLRGLSWWATGEVTLVADDNGFLKSDEPWDCIEIASVVDDEPYTRTPRKLVDIAGTLDEDERHAVNTALYRKAVGDV
jgi:hypothetical protein